MRRTNLSIKLNCGTRLHFFDINGGNFNSKLEEARHDFNACFYNCFAYWLNSYFSTTDCDPYILKLQIVPEDVSSFRQMAGNEVMLNAANVFKVKFFYYLCCENDGAPFCYQTLQYGKDEDDCIGHIAVYKEHCYVLKD